MSSENTQTRFTLQCNDTSENAFHVEISGDPEKAIELFMSGIVVSVEQIVKQLHDIIGTSSDEVIRHDEKVLLDAIIKDLQGRRNILANKETN